MYSENSGLKITMIIVGIVLFIASLFFIFPKWHVWKQSLSGQAELRKQEYSKLILIEEAKAQKESATLYANAEVERAKGVAEANEIIGDSLKGNEVYLKYLMIQTLKDLDTQLIYVPTEANLPILEASRH